MKHIDIAFETLQEIAVRCGLFAVLVVTLPILLLILPFMLWKEDKIKDGEYWDSSSAP